MLDTRDTKMNKKRNSTFRFRKRFASDKDNTVKLRLVNIT